MHMWSLRQGRKNYSILSCRPPCTFFLWVSFVLGSCHVQLNQPLQCRCNPEWTVLPHYSESFPGEDGDMGQDCPCILKRKAQLLADSPPTPAAVPVSLNSSFVDRRASRANPSQSPLRITTRTRSDSLLARSTQFERLISGQESVGGEFPPAYDDVAASPA